MKKLFIILMFFLICLTFIKDNKSQMVMSEVNNNTNHYELIFDKEPLNIDNFKLKLASFTSYDYNITKVYIKYNENIKEYFKNKEYFSFDNSDFNDGIEKMKNEYNLVLKENYLYDELDKDLSNIIIESVELYTVEDALTVFKKKYPNVVIKQIK